MQLKPFLMNLCCSKYSIAGGGNGGAESGCSLIYGSSIYLSYNKNFVQYIWAFRRYKIQKLEGQRLHQKIAFDILDVQKQYHLRMNNSTGSNNHLRSIDHFRSMIIGNNRSKVRDVNSHPPQSVSQSVRKSQKQSEYSQNVVRMQSECSQNEVRMQLECSQNVIRMQ